MIRGSPDQRENMESLQWDGLARIKAVYAFRLPVRQNKSSRSTIFLFGFSTYYQPKFLTSPAKYFYRIWAGQMKHGGRMPKRIFI